MVVGGCGHVGLPLALAFADAGLEVGIFDVDAAKLARVAAGEMPFLESGADALLARLIGTGRLHFSAESSILRRSGVVVLVVGTPIDEFMNPSMTLFDTVVDGLAPEMVDGALVILRSTVYPGTTEYVADRLRRAGLSADVVFCPERIA
ncbi:MAG TPA: NAD(P)-binding domain-containing protein, partial [Candidatus Dormibacteraeota bacterium]|nr:NAD(P)-binding domain-containing protein [Candidatus Dormibacteraeota bacterium]